MGVSHSVGPFNVQRYKIFARFARVLPKKSTLFAKKFILLLLQFLSVKLHVKSMLTLMLSVEALKIFISHL